MARKILNRKALRDEVAAAEQAQAETASTPATEATPAKAAPPKRKKRTKEAPVIRVKLFWGVFNQSMKCVAKYEYSQKRDADKRGRAVGRRQGPALRPKNPRRNQRVTWRRAPAARDPPLPKPVEGVLWHAGYDPVVRTPPVARRTAAACPPVKPHPFPGGLA